MQNERSADTEADHRAEGHHLKHGARHAEIIREQRAYCAEQANYIEPESGSNTWQILSKPDLEQQCSQPDRRHDDQGDGAEKSILPGVNDYQRERQNEQTRGDHGPSARDDGT